VATAQGSLVVIIEGSIVSFAEASKYLTSKRNYCNKISPPLHTIIVSQDFGFDIFHRKTLITFNYCFEALSNNWMKLKVFHIYHPPMTKLGLIFVGNLIYIVPVVIAQESTIPPVGVFK